MHILITYKDGSFYGKTDELFHYTEVHYNFYPKLGIQVAFESSTENTGFTRYIKDIEQIEIFDDEEQKQADE